MGQISSTSLLHDAPQAGPRLVPAVYLRSPNRFFISSIQISSDDDLLLTVLCDRKSAALVAKPETDRIVEFVLDTESATPGLLLKLQSSPVRRLKLKFNLVINVTASQPIHNLTFVTGRSAADLNSFISNELFHNPNIQNEENVSLLGDFVPPPPLSSARVAPGQEQPHLSTVEFEWDWSPPPGSPPTAGGIRTCASFAEYVKRDHSLQQLANFSFYVETLSPQPISVSSPMPFTPLTATAPTDWASEIPPLPPLATSLASTSTIDPLGTPIDAPFSPIMSPDRHAALKPSPISASPIRVPIPRTASSSKHAPAPLPALSVSSGSVPGSAPPGSFESRDAASSDPASAESIGKVLQKEKVSVSIPRPGDGSQPEDGPLFRATIASLEKKTGNLKYKIKKILKRSAMLYERLQGVVEAQRLFSQALTDAADTEVPAFRALAHSYFDKRRYGRLGVIDFNKQSAMDLNTHVIEPLRRLYDLEIKTFDLRKKEFDDESSQYYSWLARYLSMKQEAKGRKKEESDSKYLEKRKAFELSRFDYYSYMQDLHGGRKQQEVTYQLALYAELEATRYIVGAEKMKSSVKVELDSIVDEIKKVNKDWSRQRTEREDRRRALERSIMSPVESVSPIAEPSIDAVATESPQPKQRPPNLRLLTGDGNPAAIPEDDRLSNDDDSDANNDYADDYNDNEHTPNQNSDSPTYVDEVNQSNTSVLTDSTATDAESRKEGLLWAMSRPGGLSDPLPNLNKQGWHKFWVVLAGGKLCEYTNWKQGVDLHNDPIDLKVACVREARNAERRFCFEVVTLTYKRVYQATSDEDMMSWIRSINSGITSSLESSTVNSKPKKPGKRVPSHEMDHSGAYAAAVRNDRVDDGRRTESRSVSGQSQSDHPALLPVVQAVDASNLQCADCGSTVKVEWISINLLVILCIDCSGVHRSLGSHISKIRSLTLDTVSFTPELVALIRAVNNGQVNSIWERKLDSKPVINDKTRRQFITEKYVEKKFVEEVERPNALLRQAVADQNVSGVIRALASRANPNSSVPVEGGAAESSESVLLYALRQAGQSATFPVAELLLLNSANLPASAAGGFSGLSAAAASYLTAKMSRADFTAKAVPASPKSPGPGPYGHERAKTNVGTKLQKRLSGLGSKSTQG